MVEYTRCMCRASVVRSSRAVFSGPVRGFWRLSHGAAGSVIVFWNDTHLVCVSGQSGVGFGLRGGGESSVLSPCFEVWF